MINLRIPSRSLSDFFSKSSTRSLSAQFFGLLCALLLVPQFTLAQVTMPINPGLSEKTFVGGIMDIITLLASVIAVLAVLMIVISGIMYMTSLGDPARASKAKDTLTYAVIGLIIALLAWVIVKSIAVAFGV